MTQDGSAVAESVVVDVRVLPNGDADVRETLSIRMSSPGMFVRDVSYAKSDAIRVVSTAIDGRTVDRATAQTSGVIVRDGRTLHVEWPLPADGGPHVIDLHYVAERAVRVEGARGSLRLSVIPADRPYRIASARVSVTVPDAELYSGSGIAEAGWRVDRIPSGIAGDRRDLADGEGGTLVAELPIDPASTVEPRWQSLERSRAFLQPAFASAGFFMLVIGAGVLWIVRFRYPRARPATPEDERERQIVRTGLRNGGLVTIAVGLASAFVTWPFLERLGLVAMALPVSIMVIGAWFWAASKRWV